MGAEDGWSDLGAGGAYSGSVTFLSSGDVTFSAVTRRAGGAYEATVTSSTSLALQRITAVTADGVVSSAAVLVSTYMPLVSAIEPTSGPVLGGTTVRITGGNMAGATGVRFGDSPASFTVDSDSQITAISPARDIGPVNVVVLGPAGIPSPRVAVGTFTYQAGSSTATGSLQSVACPETQVATCGRFGHTATVLNDGRVLVLGGLQKQYGSPQDGEIYDPATGAWSGVLAGTCQPESALCAPRAMATATLLQPRGCGDGTVATGYPCVDRQPG